MFCSLSSALSTLYVLYCSHNTFFSLCSFCRRHCLLFSRHFIYAHAQVIADRQTENRTRARATWATLARARARETVAVAVAVMAQSSPYTTQWVLSVLTESPHQSLPIVRLPLSILLFFIALCRHFIFFVFIFPCMHCLQQNEPIEPIVETPQIRGVQGVFRFGRHCYEGRNGCSLVCTDAFEIVCRKYANAWSFWSEILRVFTNLGYLPPLFWKTKHLFSNGPR